MHGGTHMHLVICIMNPATRTLHPHTPTACRKVWKNRETQKLP